MKKIIVFISFAFIFSCKKTEVKTENCKIVGVTTTQTQFNNVLSGQNLDKNYINYFELDKDENLVKIDSRYYEKNGNHILNFVYKDKKINYLYFGEKDLVDERFVISYDTRNRGIKINHIASPNQKIEFFYNDDDTIKEIKQAKDAFGQWVNILLEYDKNKNPIQESFKFLPSQTHTVVVRKFDTRANDFSKYAFQIMLSQILLDRYDEMSGFVLSALTKNYIQQTDNSYFENEYSSTGRILNRYSYIGTKKDNINLVAKSSFLHDCK